MKHWIGVLFCLLWVPEKSFAQHSDSVYLFSYFINNGEDGLHLAYSTDGYKWTAMNNGHPVLTPMVSQDKLMRDPCIIRGGDGRFHMVWTVSWKDKGIGYASSKDLVHWSPQQFIPVMAALPGARNTWAPEITYDPSTASYMIYWASTITGSFSETDSKLEDQYNHRLYYTTTNDFKAFTPTRLLYDPGFNCIDATILHEDGRFVMYLKDETPEPAQKNIRIAYSTALAGPYSKASAPITGKHWAEGPTVTTVGKTTIVYFDKYMENRYGAVATTDGKNWTDISDSISLPEGIRHGTILKLTATEYAALAHSFGQSVSQNSTGYLGLSDALIRKEISAFVMAAKLNRPMENIPSLKAIKLRRCGSDFVHFESGDWIALDKLVDIRSGPLTATDSALLGNHLPTSKITEVRFIHYKYQLILPESAIAGLYDPKFCTLPGKDNTITKATSSACRVYESADKKRVYIYMLNGEGDTQYEVTWVISESKYVGRIIDKVNN